MVKRTQERQIPFQAVVMDDLCERNETLRQNLNQVGLAFYGDIPANTHVYLEKPQIIYPLIKRDTPSKTPKIVGTAYEVRELRQKDWLARQNLRLRANECGYLEAKFACVRVWLVYGEGPRQEWLLIRQDTTQVTYVLSNAPETIDLKTMAWRKTHRYFIERSNEDAKDGFGWDEFQTRKYRALKHQLALTILASWFVAETRIEWQQLSPEDAASLVVSHLVNRTCSRKSRLRHRKDQTNV